MARFLNLFSEKIAVDLGTSATRIYLKDKGILLDEPSLVAVNNRTDQIIALGENALKMEEKSPLHIIVTRPIQHGVVVDFEVAEKMLRNMLDKISRQTLFYKSRPTLISAVPLEVTEVEKKSLEDVISQMGVQKVYLVERPVAAAIGCKLAIQEPVANLILEMGAGLTEIAVISLGGIVAWRSLKIGGDSLDNDLINYIRDQHGLMVGKKTAEELKIKISSLVIDKPLEMNVKGRDLNIGLPREIKITNEEVKAVILPSFRIILENIRETIQSAPPELVSDLYGRGMMLSGGCTLIPGFDNFIAKELKIPVHQTNEPATNLIRGLGYILEDFDNLKEVIIPSAMD